MPQAKKPIINIDALEFGKPFGNGKSLEVSMASFSAALGAKKLGYNIHKIAPGKRAFPKHNHRVNEEMFYVLKGLGTWRVGDKDYPIRAGDFIAAPAGGRATAHQISAAEGVEMLVLAVSTKESPEIVEYPDSDKTGVSLVDPDGDKGGGLRFMLGSKEGQKDYFSGED